MPEAIDTSLTIPLYTVPRCSVCGEVMTPRFPQFGASCEDCKDWAVEKVKTKLGLVPGAERK